MKEKINASGWVFILLGLSSTFLILLTKLSRNGLSGVIEQVVYESLIALSVGVFAMGILSVLLGLKDWQVYFQKRLSEVVRQKDYIKSLNRDELIQLQVDTFRAYFKLGVDNNPNNFLSFFQKELQGLLATPFREDVNYFMEIKEYDGSDLNVSETVSYRARSVAGVLQESVRWIAQPGEYSKFSATIKIKPSDGFPSGVVVDHDGFHTMVGDEFELLDKSCGFKASLKQYSKCEYIDVVVSAEYTSKGNRYLSWTMAQLTDRFSITISHPVDLELMDEMFGIDEKHVQIIRGGAAVSIKCGTWALPNTGVVLMIRRKAAGVA